MASQRRSGTLQKQGVPIPEKLEGPNGNQQRAKTTRRASTSQRQSRPRVRQTSRSKARTIGVDAAAAGAGVEAVRRYGPTRYADKTSAGVGLLEAEYFGIIFLLLLELFVDNGDVYGNKMMSFMKRGFLTSVLFFFLALIAAVGPNAAKLSKGLGGLVFIAILISSPGQSIITAFDNFVKADWVGTNESANSTAASADTGTAESQSSALQSIASTIENKGVGNSTNIAKTIGQTFIQFVKGII